MGVLRLRSLLKVFVDIQMLCVVWVSKWYFFHEFSSNQHVPQCDLFFFSAMRGGFWFSRGSLWLFFTLIPPPPPTT